MGEYKIGEALKLFLAKSKLKNGINAKKISSVWQDIMGNTISKYTEKIEIINKTLFISTSVAALKNELLFQKQNIIKRINESFGEEIIKDVVIK